MHNREIILDPAHPENALPTLTAGAHYAASVIVRNVPASASAVKMVLVFNGGLTAIELIGAKIEGEEQSWSVRIPGDSLREAGRIRYEIVVTDGDNFWASRGVIDIKATATGAKEWRQGVYTVDGIEPDECGEIALDDAPNIVALRESVDKKAANARVDALEREVDGKAAQSALDSVAQAVGELNTALGGKADVSRVEHLEERAILVNGIGNIAAGLKLSSRLELVEGGGRIVRRVSGNEKSLLTFDRASGACLLGDAAEPTEIVGSEVKINGVDLNGLSDKVDGCISDLQYYQDAVERCQTTSYVAQDTASYAQYQASSAIDETSYIRQDMLGGKFTDYQEITIVQQAYDPDGRLETFEIYVETTRGLYILKYSTESGENSNDEAHICIEWVPFSGMQEIELLLDLTAVNNVPRTEILNANWIGEHTFTPHKKHLVAVRRMPGGDVLAEMKATW